MLYPLSYRRAGSVVVGELLAARGPVHPVDLFEICRNDCAALERLRPGTGGHFIHPVVPAAVAAFRELAMVVMPGARHGLLLEFVTISCLSPVDAGGDGGRCCVSGFLRRTPDAQQPGQGFLSAQDFAIGCAAAAQSGQGGRRARAQRSSLVRDGRTPDGGLCGFEPPPGKRLTRRPQLGFRWGSASPRPTAVPRPPLLDPQTCTPSCALRKWCGTGTSAGLRVAVSPACLWVWLSGGPSGSFVSPDFHESSAIQHPLAARAQGAARWSL